ncbi:MAG: hypothetical protein KDD53_09040, partial [Bdellovibrionales bacterium]|nr:hypothetical protein [Bdellovibrionales bacterium]
MVRVIDPCAQERGFGLVVGIFMLSIIILFYVVVLDLSVAKRDHLRRQFDAINAADAAYHNINFKDAALSSASWGLDLATGMSKPYAKPIETTQALPGGLSATLTYTENSPKADHIGVALSGQLGLLDGFLGL